MKRICFLLLLISTVTSAQNPEVARELVLEGVALYDEGKYSQAISKYDDALKVDKDNFLALAEKAMTLVATRDYSESIKICKKVLKLHPNEELSMLYVTYGNATDLLNDSKKAIKIYDEGIQKYPNQFQLYFNKGIALTGLGENEKAKEAIQSATVLKPNHPGSFNVLGILNENNRIAAIMSACRFLSLDNKSARANENINYLLKLMNKGISTTGENSISISLDESLLSDSSSKATPNNFSSTEMILSLSAALDNDEAFKDDTNVDKFSRKLSILFGSLTETKDNQSGYYWEYLAPYFIDMKKQDLVNTFANIAFAANNDKDAIKFLKENKEKVDAFYNWSNSFQWL